MKKLFCLCALSFATQAHGATPIQTVKQSIDTAITAPVYIPKGAIETEKETLEYAQKAALNVLVGYFANKGTSFGATPTLSSVVSYLKAYRRSGVKPADMDKRAEKIVAEFNKYMKEISDKLIDIRRYFAPNPEQIDKLVDVHLREDGYFAQLDEYFKP